MEEETEISPIQRQVSLPFSKAVEIAYKSIRLRLSRSLLVTSGIVLALAFLMSILSSDALVNSMRRWASTPAAQREELISRQRLESLMRSKGVPFTAQEIASA